jgi:hypothetical protein
VFTTALHSYKETLTDCKHCNAENTLVKVLSVPYYGVKNLSKKDQTVGDVTNEYIDANKEILEDLKKTSKSETYEPT